MLSDPTGIRQVSAGTFHGITTKNAAAEHFGSNFDQKSSKSCEKITKLGWHFSRVRVFVRKKQNFAFCSCWSEQRTKTNFCSTIVLLLIFVVYFARLKQCCRAKWFFNKTLLFPWFYSTIIKYCQQIFVLLKQNGVWSNKILFFCQTKFVSCRTNFVFVEQNFVFYRKQSKVLLFLSNKKQNFVNKTLFW